MLVVIVFYIKTFFDFLKGINIIKDNDILKNSFGDYDELKLWVQNTKYRNYISITYHFKNKKQVTRWRVRTLDQCRRCFCVSKCVL